MSTLTHTASANDSPLSGIAVKKEKAAAKPYWNPYLSGIGLGLVLLLSFVVMGRGLGASGAFSTVLATGISKVAPEHAKTNEYYAGYLGDGSANPLKDWLVFEVLGVLAGGFISGALAGRIKKTVEKGPNITNRGRLILAFIGAVIMGFGAKLAGGCTSGQALTGGAVLNVGSWAFMMAVFAGGYAMSYFVRKEWI